MSFPLAFTRRRTRWSGILCVTMVATLLLPSCGKDAATPTPPPQEKAWTSLIDEARAFKDLSNLAAIGGISHAPDAAERLNKGRSYIKDGLRAAGFTNAQFKNDFWEQEVPNPGFESGRKVWMENIVAVLQGKSDKAIAIAAHYDNKILAGKPFVGANDGASGVAVVLEMARKLKERADKEGPPPFSIYFVLFDGEEAFVDWNESYNDAPDNCYGSRRMAKDRQKYPIETLLLVDMVGDADLKLIFEVNSDGALREIFSKSSEEFFGVNIFGAPKLMLDDHIPFKENGMLRVINLIDFDFGNGNSYWHTEQDTADKCSPKSLAKVGSLLLTALPKVEEWLAKQLK